MTKPYLPEWVSMKPDGVSILLNPRCDLNLFLEYPGIDSEEFLCVLDQLRAWAFGWTGDEVPE